MCAAHMGAEIVKKPNISVQGKILKKEEETTPDTRYCITQAKKYVVEGKILETQGRYDKAIEIYNKSINLNPRYAVAYYNRRNAMDKKEKAIDNIPPAEEMGISELIGEFEHFSLPSTNFVISTIGCVSEDEFSSDSSDEEKDGTFSEEMFNFSNKSSMPFTNTRPKYKRPKSKRPRLENVFKSNFEDVSNLKEGSSILPRGNSIVVAPLLQKLSEKGFEENDKDKLESVSVSIGLNRMKSLSTRKNNLLVSELESNVETSVRHEKFAFYWNCDWYSTEEEEYVEYENVRKFYKQLKRIDSKKAQEFREVSENDVPVPYQELREYAKNHSKTKKLVQEFRGKNPGANVYFSLIDSDTIDFNGIYSAYLRIVANCSKIPTVMTTGYNFPVVDKDKGGLVYHFASHVDRKVRIKTTYHLPPGVYYPEPNMCILIPQKNDTLPESFMYSKKNYESPCLLINLQEKRQNVTFIFSEDKPLITRIPDRAKLTKSRKNQISFSFGFIEGASPTKDDFKSCKQVAQSHLHEKVWYDNLFINGAIEIKQGTTIAHCKHLLAEFRNSEETAVKDMFIFKLKECIDHHVVDAIVKATTEVKKYVKEKEIDYVRSEDEEKFLNILKEHNIKLESVSSREKLLMLSQEMFIELIEKDKVNPRYLIALDIEALEYICDDWDIIEMLKKKDIYFDTILSLLDKENLQYYISARENFSDLHILENYKKNPLHLQFMASATDEDDDIGPTQIVYENSHDAGLVEFALENYNIDIQYVRCELNKGRTEVCASLTDFDSIIDNCKKHNYDREDNSDQEDGYDEEDDYEKVDDYYEGDDYKKVDDYYEGDDYDEDAPSPNGANYRPMWLKSTQ